ncbi:DNA modification methylase [Agromyces arachidis]|uniref:DNA modification methylase n=1 Tax=Agromyces arachidis TaxID=766966 RepID=UPI0040577D22
MKARLAASAALALGIAIGGSGCAMITYQATTEEYDASDGISVDVGALEVRNALVVSDDGEEGNLVLSVTNSGDEDATLGIEIAGETIEIDVDAGETVSPGATDEEPVLVERLDAEVGGLVTAFFVTEGAEGREVTVPVLDGRLPEYEELVP